MVSGDAFTKWTQYTVDAVDAVCSGCSRIVIYGGGDIVFDTKRSNQRTQWTQYAVDAVDIFFDAKNVKPVDSVDAVTQWTQYTVDAVDTVHSGHSRIVVYGVGDIVFHAKRSNQRMQWMQYAVD